MQWNAFVLFLTGSVVRFWSAEQGVRRGQSAEWARATFGLTRGGRVGRLQKFDVEQCLPLLSSWTTHSPPPPGIRRLSTFYTIHAGSISSQRLNAHSITCNQCGDLSRSESNMIIGRRKIVVSEENQTQTQPLPTKNRAVVSTFTGSLLAQIISVLLRGSMKRGCSDAETRAIRSRLVLGITFDHSCSDRWRSQSFQCHNLSHSTFWSPVFTIWKGV